MVKGTYECEQLITSDNILKKSTCHETHLFRPFSKESSGALTDVTTKLVFRKKDQIMSTSEGTLRTFPIVLTRITNITNFPLKDSTLNDSDVHPLRGAGANVFLLSREHKSLYHINNIIIIIFISAINT